MRKSQKIFIMLSIMSFVTLLFSFSASAWDDCPFGIEDEPYPGTCWRYVDQNNDGICDHSQSEPTEQTIYEGDEAGVNSQQQDRTTNRFPALLVFSFLITLALILILKLMVEKKKISDTKEKIIFNILLLIFFLPSAITGIVLLLMTNMGIMRDVGQSFTQIHNISSLFFMWICAYHIIWHTKYYVKSMRKLLK